ncbi:hypothetical protein [Tannerella forsythia]|uniref:hypothetical protein n=1 Tax=Tannerella forsythia TaxID=28112 RepID=UPI00163A0094|nr:hypothetical protein [Tannerella forsythia]
MLYIAPSDGCKTGRAVYYRTRRMNRKEQSGTTIAPADTILNEQLPLRYTRLQKPVY